MCSFLTGFALLPYLLYVQSSDVKDVGYVVVRLSLSSFYPLLLTVLQNYDFPNNCEDYIHRIGRTGVSALCFRHRLAV
jgi:hypothetical protein